MLPSERSCIYTLYSRHFAHYLVSCLVYTLQDTWYCTKLRLQKHYIIMYWLNTHITHTRPCKAVLAEVYTVVCLSFTFHKGTVFWLMVLWWKSENNTIRNSEKSALVHVQEKAWVGIGDERGPILTNGAATKSTVKSDWRLSLPISKYIHCSIYALKNLARTHRRLKILNDARSAY